MIDALIGVVIIGLTISVVMLSLGISRHMSRQAADLRQAGLTLAVLAVTTPSRPGDYSGVKDGLHYDVSVTEVRNREIVLCRFHAVVTDENQRRHSLDGTRWCETAS